jgi:DNA-binding NarL/FixJ family response regulator
MVESAGQTPDHQTLVTFTAQVHQRLQRWRVLIATPHRPYANLLMLQLVNEQPEPPGLPQRLLAICDSCSAVRQHLPDKADDVFVLMEDMLRDGSVLPLVEEIMQRPLPPCVVLAMGSPLQPALVRAAWRAGVQALVYTDDYGNGELARSMAAIDRGERYCGATMAALLVRDLPLDDALSRRELEVLPLLAEGLTNRQIAQRLQIAEVTARDHVQRIVQKLQVSDRTAAAALAVRLGLVP